MKRRSQFIAIIGLAIAALSVGAQAKDKVTHFTTADGTRVTLTWGQPAARHYGPPPPFAKLDRDHDGYLTTDEANAYPPLVNEFELASQGHKRISKAQFQRWTRLHNG